MFEKVWFFCIFLVFIQNIDEMQMGWKCEPGKAY